MKKPKEYLHCWIKTDDDVLTLHYTKKKDLIIIQDSNRISLKRGQLLSLAREILSVYDDSLSKSQKIT